MKYLQFDQAFNRFNYPTGEVHVELKEGVVGLDDAIIEAHCRTAEDLFAVSMAASIAPNPVFFIPYLPFARHDHRRSNLDGFPLGQVQRLLDEVDVLIADPHSDMTAVLFNHIAQREIVNFFRSKRGPNFHPTFLIPDAGATKKAYTWLKPDDLVFQGIKKRNRATGKLSGFQIVYEDMTEDIADRTIVIVDDICDGGGTFLGLVEKLREVEPRAKVELWVTHGMFQEKKWMALADTFSKIVSFQNPGNWYLRSQPPFELYDFKELIV